MSDISVTAEQVAGAIRHGMRGGGQRYELDGLESGQKSATYEGNLAHYRAVAQNCLSEGDYLQAAEKTWGAYAQAVNAVCADHGIRVSTHSNIVSAAQALNALAASADAPGRGPIEQCAASGQKPASAFLRKRLG